MSGPITHISGVGRVIVPVSDQDRALAFYLQALGMEKRTDVPAAGGDRWIEVAPAVRLWWPRAPEHRRRRPALFAGIRERISGRCRLGAGSGGSGASARRFGTG